MIEGFTLHLGLRTEEVAPVVKPSAKEKEYHYMLRKHNTKRKSIILFARERLHSFFFPQYHTKKESIKALVRLLLLLPCFPALVTINFIYWMSHHELRYYAYMWAVFGGCGFFYGLLIQIKVKGLYNKHIKPRFKISLAEYRCYQVVVNFVLVYTYSICAYIFAEHYFSSTLMVTCVFYLCVLIISIWHIYNVVILIPPQATSSGQAE